MITTARYKARMASTKADIARAQVFRGQVFRGYQDGRPDEDIYDHSYEHLLIEKIDTGELVGCVRFCVIANGARLDGSYSADQYGLDQFATLSGAKMEMGRFCIAPSVDDPDVLRLIWAVITQIVDTQQVCYLFGCSSFEGQVVDIYRDAFALLTARHLAPAQWRPTIKAPDTYNYAHSLCDVSPDVLSATKSLPPLLRTYLSLGGVVSDHAVIDADLNTLHVFTSLEIALIPERRKQVLRGLDLAASV